MAASKMKNLRKRGDVWYGSVHVDGRTVERALSKDRREAQRMLRELRRDLRLRPPPVAKQLDELADLTVREALEEVNRRRRLLPNPPKTVDDEAKRLADHVYPVIGDVPLLELRARHLVALARVLREKVSEHTRQPLAANTQANIWGVVVTYLKAEERRLRRELEVTWQSPADLLEPRERPRAVRRPRGYFRRDEVEALISDHRIPLYRRVLWHGLFGTGMRLSEFTGLQHGDVDWSAEPLSRILLRRQRARSGAGWQPLKEDKHGVGITREVPVHPSLAAALRAWRSGPEGWVLHYTRFPTDEDYLVPRITDPSKPLSQGSVYRWLQQDCATVGATGRAVHCTRNTFITLVDQDAPELRHVAKGITHSVAGDAQDGYRRSEWLQRCAVMQAFRLGEKPVAEVVALPLAAGDRPGKNLASEENIAKIPTKRARMRVQ